MVMQENIELNSQDKIRLKTISAQQVKHMKDMLLEEAKVIMENGDDIPRVEREDESNRSSLIIKLDESLKDEIKVYCGVKSVRIRDFWVECVQRIIKRYQ